MNCLKYNVLTLLISLLVNASMSAQQPVVRANLDTVAIPIGGQVGLTVAIFAPRNMDVHVKQLQDSIGSNVEVVRQLAQDTVMKEEMVTYMQRYLLTSFDSGLHYLPATAVVYTADGDSICTPELSLNVFNPFHDVNVP